MKTLPPPTLSLAADVVSRLVAIVGERAVLTDSDRLLVYESDALGRHHRLPIAVVLPSSTDEAARVVQVVHDAGLTIVPRGAGTGLSGGAVANEGSVIIGTARMNRILEFDPARRRARVQAGVLNAQLAALVKPHGLVYAPDPSSQAACTLGGNVAENSGGPHCLKYGVTRRYVHGVTMIDGDGAVVEVGGERWPKGDAPELLGPVIGSEGCFGLVTEIELGLVPDTEGVRTLLGLFETTAEAGEAVTAIISDGLLPAALEIVDRHTIAAVEGSPYRAGYPTGVGAALVVEFDGNEFELDADADRAEVHCLAAGATEVRRATDPADRLRLWQGRKKAFGTMGRLAPDLMVQDATVPRSILPDVLRKIDEVAERYDIQIANVFHAGDGNLHPNLLYDRRDEEHTARVEKAAGEIMKICVDAGGTITGEHGVGLDKRDYVRLIAGEDEIAAMAAVCDAFDPDRRWNPGKVLPDPAADTDATDDAGDSTDAAATSRFTPPPPPTRVEVNPPDLSVRVPGATSWAEVRGAMAEDGQWTPIGAGAAEATVAEALHRDLGPLEALWGPIRESVLGATVETEPGRRLHLGGRVVKNVAGFDLLGLFVGEGASGDVVDVTLRSYPMPGSLQVLTWSSAAAAELTADAPGPAATPSAPGFPWPRVITAGAHHLLLSGTPAWVDHERARLSAVFGDPTVATGPSGVDAFFRTWALSTEVVVEVRPTGEEAHRFGDIVAGLGASVRWSWDPTLRRGRLGTTAEAVSPERWVEISIALANEGGGCSVVCGPPALRDAVREAREQAVPSRAAAAGIAERVRRVIGGRR